MKNKHLVLLFIVTLLAGWLFRRLPWRFSDIFQTVLIEVDATALQSISIGRPGATDLLLERTDEGWVTELDGRSVRVPGDIVDRMLQELAHVKTLRIVKTARPDTVGLQMPLRVQATLGNGRREVFFIGRQTTEQGVPATYIELDHHDGIYLVKNHLRDVFDQDAARFRPATAFQLAVEGISEIQFYWNKADSVAVVKKNDALPVWAYGLVEWPGDSVHKWLMLLPRLNGTPFADHFDDSQSRQTLVAKISLIGRQDSTPLELEFHYLAPPEIPEDPESLAARHNLSAWVLHSSQNPNNYFCINDTNLLRHILYDLSR
ncbi:MAG: DUF4340 domain-containing protein [Bacteroidetes bacterium]|nr:DUF4340 domain-containing protein [Bacteroidota bacterium]